MVRWMLIAACLVWVAAGSVYPAAGAAVDWPTAWQAGGSRDHPLVGKIYDTGAGKLVSPEAYLARLTRAPHVALGEVHDNPDVHRLQAWAVRRIGGKRVIIFEQFRTDQQGVLDAFHNGVSKWRVAEAVDKLFLVTGWATSGWPDKALYRPLMAAAIESGRTLLGGNPPRQRVFDVAREGLSALSQDAQHRLLLDRGLGSALDEALLEELEASHCNLMPKSAFTNMALAQRLKDGTIARVMADATVKGEGTVLIAGNGHVRRDRGAPWYLSRMLAVGEDGATVAVAHVEVDPARRDPAQYAQGDAYSFVVFVPVAARPDPCEEMRKRFKPRSRE